MSFIIGLLTVILVLDCLLLLLLILIQLPKKEAGAGVAFGGGATDALFGAGSGTALTKITKYSAGVFLGLSLLLSVMRAQQANEGGRKFEEELKRKAAAGPVIPSALAPTNSMTSTAAVPAALPLLQPSNPAKTKPAAGPGK